MGYGEGKVQYHFFNTPATTVGLDPSKLCYSPAWLISLGSYWKLTNSLSFSASLDHLTITEFHKDYFVPSWDPGAEKLIQSFIHISPGISGKFSNDRFRINSAFRIGSINFLGQPAVRESSSAVAHMDFGFTAGCSIKTLNHFRIETSWIQGLTHHLITRADKDSYWKYHNFLLSICYELD